MELNLNIKADTLKEFDEILERLGKLSMEVTEDQPKETQEHKEVIQDFETDIQTTEAKEPEQPKASPTPDQPKVHKSNWTPEEDAKLLRLVEEIQGWGKWKKIADALGKKYHTVLMHHKLLTKQQKPKAKKKFYHKNGALDK